MQKKVDFNKYCDNYLDLLSEQHSKFGDIKYYSKQKADVTKEVFGSKFENILEFGCGIGRNLPFFKEIFTFSKIYASDISSDSLKVATKNNPEINFIDDDNLKNYKNYFDLIIIAGVFHHIEPKLRNSVTKKIYQLLKTGGKLICFEHNPYNPITRKMVNTCSFDEDAILLTQKEMLNIFLESDFEFFDKGYILFVPPKLKRFNFIERYFKYLPFGGQYFVAVTKK